MANIAHSEFIVYGYIHNFRLHGETWFCQASLIVDKDLKSDEKKYTFVRPFIFQAVSFPVFGLPRKLLESYSDEVGALRGFGVKLPNGKSKIFRFRIGGYRFERSSNPEFPIDVKGRILSIDDTENEIE